MLGYAGRDCCHIILLSLESPGIFIFSPDPGLILLYTLVFYILPTQDSACRDISAQEVFVWLSGRYVPENRLTFKIGDIKPQFSIKNNMFAKPTVL